MWNAFFDLALQWWNRPKINIEAGEISETEDGIIRVVVKNEGKTSAKNCRGKISIECSADDLREDFFTVIKPRRFRPVKEINLRWTNTYSGSITINAHDNEPLTVFQKIPKKSDLVIAVHGDTHPFGDYICVLKYLDGKDYRGKINITAANAKGKEINFRIKMEDDMIKTELFNEW
ncbi:hypothetical protein C5S30_00800 [ANME-1 cluster archaeon GoMg4]|nr:hypothetical protein [ANME-1 cluster archaeon GoMg4]